MRRLLPARFTGTLAASPFLVLPQLVLGGMVADATGGSQHRCVERGLLPMRRAVLSG